MARQAESTRTRAAKAGRIDVVRLSGRGKDGAMAQVVVVVVVVVGDVFVGRHLVVAVVTEDQEAKSRGALTFGAV